MLDFLGFFWGCVLCAVCGGGGGGFFGGRRGWVGGGVVALCTECH